MCCIFVGAQLIDLVRHSPVGFQVCFGFDGSPLGVSMQVLDSTCVVCNLCRRCREGGEHPCGELREGASGRARQSIFIHAYLI
jgi:hypothetical protein